MLHGSDFIARLLRSLCLHLQAGLIPDKALGQLVLVSAEVLQPHLIYLDLFLVTY